MFHFYTRLSTKFILATLLFLVILGTATAAAITAGFRQTQYNATQLSVQGLQEQGRETLLRMTRREAQISDAHLQEALQQGEIAADYLRTTWSAHASRPWSLAQLQQTPEGGRYDPDPNRRSEIWIDPSVAVTSQTERNLRQSQPLEALLPALIDHASNTIAIYYMDPQGASRYYPVVDRVDMLPLDLAVQESAFFRLAVPQANPERMPVWSPPYVDHVGLGPVATASVPVYIGDEFIGVIGVDVSLTQMIGRLNDLTLTQGSYALLVDHTGNLVAAPPAALADLLPASRVEQSLASVPAAEKNTARFIQATLGIPLDQAENEVFLHTLSAMRQGASGLAQFDLNGRPVYLAYAPLPSVGWSLAMVAPIAEITAESAAVTTAIRADADTTVRWTLLIITLFFGLALLGTMLMTSRFLTHPIEALVTATRQVAAGDRSVTLPVHSHDELGQLADSFNRMTEQIVQAQQTLEQRVADRTRELSVLYDVTAVASRSLDQETVLESSLERVLEVMGCDSGGIHLLEEDGNVLRLAAGRHIPPEILAHGSEMPGGLVGWVIAHGKPLVTPDLAGEQRVLDLATTRIGAGHAYLGVPMRAKNSIVGVLSVIGQQGRCFHQEEVALLTTIADQVGVAVENARLYEQAEQLAVVEERQRLARELHDSVTQSLYSVNLMTETARRTADVGDLERTQYLVARSSEIARQALKEMRLLVYELRPAALTQEGLLGALQQRIDTVESRAGVRARLLVTGDPDGVSSAVEANLYRIAQEALNNSLKHAAASEVTISIAFEHDAVKLIVADNGRGFDPAFAQEGGGLGLKTMRERTECLGGTFGIDSDPQTGTIVEVCLPLYTIPAVATGEIVT